MKFAGLVKASPYPKGLELVHALHAGMARMEPPRPAHIIHASALTNDEVLYCPREHALGDLYPETRKARPVHAALQYAFDLGNALADRLTNKWAKAIAIGDWQCTSCGHIHRFCKYPEFCLACKDEDTMRYLEVRFTSQGCGASGGIDLLVNLTGSLLDVVEIKTIKNEDFKALQAPLPEHRLRTNLYLRLIADSLHPHRKEINTASARILYMTKGFGSKNEAMVVKRPDTRISPFREFRIDRDDSATNVYYNKAKALSLFRTDGVMPEGVCPNVLCKRAQECGAVKPCFSGGHPAGAIIKKG